MTDLEDPGLRCTDCTAMGIECPKGYPICELHCEACSYEFVLLRPGCLTEDPADDACPECNLHELAHD